MIISDLEHLEVVGTENRVAGGTASVSGAVASASASGTNQASVSISVTTSTSFIQNLFPSLAPYFVSSSSSGSVTATAS